MSQKKGLFTLPGSSALSAFRRKELAKKIGAEDVEAQFLHFVEIDSNATGLTAEEFTTLKQILEYGDPCPDLTDRVERQSDKSVRTFWITPRPGTISPWSTQATNIAQICGLKMVRRVERGRILKITTPPATMDDPKLQDKLYDRMTQTFLGYAPDLAEIFATGEPAPVNMIKNTKEDIEEANEKFGLALAPPEIDFLVNNCGPYLSDSLLMMFSQVNSEHCRHKVFNASWTIGGESMPYSLFQMIKNTHKQNPQKVLSAYSDNAAVMEGEMGIHWAPDYATGQYTATKEMIHYLAKVETHNHPTMISPFPGAATGSGGEIRDEGAVGRGSKPKAALVGFTTSDVLIDGFEQPWELDVGRPSHIASAFDIMVEGPIGAAAFNNEFGRPCLLGYWRTLTTREPSDNNIFRGYHKPLMLAGGVGTVREPHVFKDEKIVHDGDHLIAIGGPAMLIGLGGGAASSKASGEGSAELDFASVQRGNAEVQRRAQEVINACTALGANNPILFIHDVGAGGLSNAFPELVHDANLGAMFWLSKVDTADAGMSPMEIWCCEAQERYVVAVNDTGLDTFRNICIRERCAFSEVGIATDAQQLILLDRDDHTKIIDLPMSTLFGKAPRMSKVVECRKLEFPTFDASLKSYLPKLPDEDIINEAVSRVLQLPSVAGKGYLITIGDRTVGGLTARDQMVGKWQVPVSDVAVTATSLEAGVKTGEAMAIGERPILALISPAASARMAVGEALLNLAAADIKDRLSRVNLSANWMSAVNNPGEGAALYEAVNALGMELCPALGISIPVGKDSLSMKMKWEDKEVVSPLSLVISAFAPVSDIRKTLTPALRPVNEDSILFFVDLSGGPKNLGGSAIAQVFGMVGDAAPDVRDPQLLKDFILACEEIHETGVALAYHDVSDGGLFTTLAEMVMAGRCGLDVDLSVLTPVSDTASVVTALFNEELGAVFQVRKRHESLFRSCFANNPDLPLRKIASVTTKNPESPLTLWNSSGKFQSFTRSHLQRLWSSTSHAMQRRRDNPSCADAEYDAILDDTDPGLSYNLTFKPAEPPALPLLSSITSRLLNAKPRVAILREEGINGHAEMAAAFSLADFAAIDVHMSDLLSGRVSLSSFRGIAACGGFSYGDVLGAGQGWAKSVLLHASVRAEFAAFFERPDTFALGVCNGCQFLSRMKELIPGAESWPTFERNASEQFEARVCMVEVCESDKTSIFFDDMVGSKLPIAVAHGEGRVLFSGEDQREMGLEFERSGLVAVRYVDNKLEMTETYPFNPNGSPFGITGVRNRDGRVLALMPHPERTVLAGIGSWIPAGKSEEWGVVGPWGRLFWNARRWCS